MESKVCTACGQQVRGSHSSCWKCNTSFSGPVAAGAVIERKPDSVPGESRWKAVTRIFGLLLVLAGLGAAVYFYGFFDISVEVPKTVLFGTTIGGGRVANLSLMAERQNGIMFGFGVAIVGAVLLYLGRSGGKAAAEQRKCPKSEELIKDYAENFRYCQKELIAA
jgi:hypothetical protein